VRVTEDSVLDFHSLHAQSGRRLSSARTCLVDPRLRISIEPEFEQTLSELPPKAPPADLRSVRLQDVEHGRSNELARFV